MVDFQIWLVRTFARATPVATMMKTAWGWPAAESVHFIGLCLLVGAIFLFDLRLIGVAKRIPIGALHRLIPWGLAGFAMTAGSGILFVLTEPDQYVYNPAFHFKMLFMVDGGPQRVGVLRDVVPQSDSARRSGRSAAAGEDHRRRVALPLDWRHRRRTPDHVSSPVSVRT